MRSALWAPRDTAASPLFPVLIVFSLWGSGFHSRPSNLVYPQPNVCGHLWCLFQCQPQHFGLTKVWRAETASHVKINFQEEWYLWSYTLEHFSCLVSHKDTSTCWKCSMCWSSCLQCCVLFQQASSVQWCCSCVVLCMVERLKHKHLWGLCGLHPVLVFWVCWLSLPAKLQRFTQPAIPQGSAKWEP